ncbi:MAG: NUDIX domain-containing protein [Candidatus Nanohalobium sp.]
MEPEEVATAVAFNNEKGEFLLLKRSRDRKIHPGKWDFPSGRIQQKDAPNSISGGNADGHIDNEEPKHAALRELEEETGLKGTVLKTGKPFMADAEDGRFKVHPFLVKIEGEPELSREHTEHTWITPEELEKFDTVEGLREDLKRVGAVE